MTDPQDRLVAHGEDLTLAIVVHGLYIVSLLLFPPAALVGVVMAHVSEGAAGPRAASHYRFQVRTFWIGLAAWLLAGVALFWGAVLSVILVGIPLLVAAGLASGAIWLWALVRCAMGLAWALQSRPVPNPDSFAF